jgi:hypothetical protein
MYLVLTENINNIAVFFGVSMISISFIIYGKLKSKKTIHKDTENRIPDIHSHQMSSTSRSKSTSVPSPVPSSAHSSNPLVRLIMGFTGSAGSTNGTQYQRFDDNGIEGEECGSESRDANHTMKKPATAEAGSQVCQDIINKRERRSRSRECSGEEGDDSVPREGFIQEIFESSAPSAAPAASCCENTNQASSESAKLLQSYTCSVCLDELRLGNTNMTTTSCGHTFHLSCLLKSLVQKNLCPMCRGELEDTRVKQMPSNILTPVSAEQIIDEEISYFGVASHAHSITLSRHPIRRAKEMLRVFGFTLLRSIAEYVHDENMPPGWYDDGESESESEEEETENEDDATENGEEGEEGGSETEGENRGGDEDELNYAVENERRSSRQQEEQAAQQRQNTRSSLRNGRDLRDFISE